MNRLWLKSPADLDYFQAVEWYQAQQPGLGAEFDAELVALLERIKDSPETFPLETRHIRKAQMPRFRYRIYFTVEKAEIGVLAIWHPSRDPNELSRRFK